MEEGREERQNKERKERRREEGQMEGGQKEQSKQAGQFDPGGRQAMRSSDAILEVVATNFLLNIDINPASMSMWAHKGLNLGCNTGLKWVCLQFPW